MPLHHSTPDPAINDWYRKAAAAREARRPAYRATTAPSEAPSAELARLAEKFRTAGGGKQVGDVRPPAALSSVDDSFITANLSNNSILESDFLDNSIALIPVPAPPHPPPPRLCPRH
jgi:hypothetical protein